MRDQSARAHHRDVRAELLDLAEQVARDEDGGALGGERADEAAHLARALRIEAVAGLVEDQQVPRPEQGVGDAESLLHAERVCVRLLLRRVTQADPVEGGIDPGAAGRGRRVQIGRVQAQQVGSSGEEGVDRRPLDESADTRQHGAERTRHGCTEHSDLAAARAGQPEQHADGRRFTRAVRAEEAEDGAAGNRQVEVVDGTLAPEDFREARSLDGRVGGHRAKITGRRTRGSRSERIRPARVRHRAAEPRARRSAARVRPGRPW